MEVEVALAKAQARAKVIPQDAADHIESHAQAASLDITKLREETEIVGYPILPLVRQLVAMCGEYAGKYLHWGATTQDIMDTATILQVKSGLSVVERNLDQVIQALENLAEKHKQTPMAGRTHLQHALPVTFGYKCAVWLSSFYRHRERLTQLRPRVQMVQYGGAAGTLASLGSPDVGLKVRKELASEVGLADPSISWHVSRDGIAETLNLLALIGGSIGKIALDVMIMCSNEVGEVAEPFVPHRGASSTMPQKRNPISSELMLAASKALRSNAGLTLDAMVSDFERASGPWHLEWIAVPESFTLAVGALHQTAFVLSGLAVNDKQMLANLNSTKGLIVGEAVMMGLAPSLGRQKAHDVVYDACQAAIRSGLSLFDALSEHQDIIDAFGAEELKRLCDPVNYLGGSARMVEDVLALKR